MKREVKFRSAFFKHSGEFSHFNYWGFLNHKDEYDDRCFKAPSQNNNSYRKYDDQFTGLHDKNGKEVFADDIMRVGEYMFRVYAVPGGFSIKPPFWSRDMGELNTGDELIMNPLGEPQNIAWIRDQCEVIGNIYENKELLK